MAMAKRAFDPKLLEFLVCPLSKTALRKSASNPRKKIEYSEKRQELISDELGVAYPIIDGIPNLIPLDGRIMEETEDISRSARAPQASE
ncbi:protein preY, mitochondrial-like isoform X1 [Selaginella moellendorffii]|uniref:protein preY, mitochondrial-like isoform X1 n=1 Tax=Selaginella moellendorffii TaxID=88036 RepID=UPI000D1C8ABA|nr:protein preY, mitochondrial-like isoform X1 [Selaginella moellendorffii]|eukprot:XP_024527222.1 protein preY, mitochondrial-like isoform X1 [Selaginella moellendorffii]